RTNFHCLPNRTHAESHHTKHFGNRGRSIKRLTNYGATGKPLFKFCSGLYTRGKRRHLTQNSRLPYFSSKQLTTRILSTRIGEPSCPVCLSILSPFSVQRWAPCILQ